MRAVIVLGFTAACFGEGPVPPRPDDATVIFTVPETATTSAGSCTGLYIGDVAIGTDDGFAILVPYSPSNCMGGASKLDEPYPLYHFHPRGGASEMLGKITQLATSMSGGPEPRIVVRGSEPLFVFDVAGSGMTELHTNTGFGVADTIIPTPNTMMPVGLVYDGVTTYLATMPDTGTSFPNNPEYPCCGLANSSGGGGPQSGQIIALPSTVLATPNVYCSVVPSRCLVTDTTSLYFFAIDGAGFEIATITKTGGIAGTIAKPTPRGSAPVPIGLATDGSRVVWGSSVDYRMQSSFVQPGCEIAYADLATGTVTTPLSTAAFSCQDVVLDGDVVYFTIVSAQPQNGDSGNSNLSLKGEGIGRLDLVSGALDSVQVGFAGYNAGPRRLYVDATSLYAIDPLAIASIPKAAIAGHHDFTP